MSTEILGGFILGALLGLIVGCILGAVVVVIAQERSVKLPW